MANVVPLNAAPQPARKVRVLVVEDNLDSVRMTTALLRSMGHEVEFAINGFAALAIARRFHPEIILFDMKLPDIRGDELIGQLKWEPGLEDTRMIAITGLPLDEVSPGLRALGCTEIYAKPLEPALLERLIDSTEQ